LKSDARSLGQKRLLRFPQFHRAHHNNKLYRCKKKQHCCCGDERKESCGKKALGLWPSAGREGVPFPLHFPEVLRVLWALYFAKKRVQYDSGRRAAKELGMSAPGTAREEHQAMEFSVTKSALLNELSTTQGVVERKTTIPILSNLLVEA
jgi:hypothetical protein